MTTISPIWSKPKIYAGIEFRSTFEANVADFLDAQGIKWIYEPGVIKLPGAKGYMPDFWLPELLTILEPRGYKMDESERKLSIMRCLIAEGRISIADGKFVVLDRPGEFSYSTVDARTPLCAGSTDVHRMPAFATAGPDLEAPRLDCGIAQYGTYDTGFLSMVGCAACGANYFADFHQHDRQSCRRCHYTGNKRVSSSYIDYCKKANSLVLRDS